MSGIASGPAGHAYPRVTASSVLFLLAAFPFVIPIVPGTDTQPAFSLLAIAIMVLALLASIERIRPIPVASLVLATTLVAGGLLWLAASLVANGFVMPTVNRVASFVMFLLAVAVGLVNTRLITPFRITMALATYIVFTVVFFVTDAAVERTLIQSRATESFALAAAAGRGAASLSPEPSFFAFQIFSLFLAARLMVWDKLRQPAKRFVTLASAALLLGSLSGYGALYALVVLAVSGFRYILGAGVLLVAAVAATTFVGFDAGTLRFVQIATTILSASGSDAVLFFADQSFGERMRSFGDYLGIFMSNMLFGDGFAYFGGGGLVSLPAGVGLYGAALLLLFLLAISTVKARVSTRLVLLFWFIAQSISGPIGLPFVGLIIGMTIGRSQVPAVVASWIASRSPTSISRLSAT
jgi:hypothetical protein